MPQNDAKTRLRLVCVGTGRDGTQSVTHMFRDVMNDIGNGETVAHEYASREFFEAFVESREGDHQSGLAKARKLIEECPHDIIVGNGYAPWLPLFAEICGPRLCLVHLRRLDRKACIDSLVENAIRHPAAYGNYNEGKLAVTSRPTAWHFNEMNKDDWNRLTIHEKLAWYYDKVHNLVDQHARLFATSFNIYTEKLSSQSTLHLIGELASGPPRRAKPIHLNSHIKSDAISLSARHKVQWLLGRLDMQKVAHDDLYPLKYMMNEYIAWTGYQIRRSEHIGPDDFRSREQLAAALTEVCEMLDGTRNLVGQLEADLRAADFGESAPPEAGYLAGTVDMKNDVDKEDEVDIKTVRMAPKLVASRAKGET